MRRVLPLLLLALVACGDTPSVRPGASATPSPSRSAYAADAVVLRVSSSGGLLPSHHVGELPRWTLYGDGRITTLGPQIEIYPGPAFPNVRVRRVSPATVDWLAGRARAAGVDGVERDYGTPPIADGTSTDFRLGDATGTVELSVYMLGHDSPGYTGYTAEQKANRDRLAGLLAILDDPSTWPGTTGEDDVYEARTVAVYARPYEHDDHPNGVGPQEIAWRGADPATGEDVRGNDCTLLTGDALASVLPDLRRSNTLTRWTYGGKAWTFAIRPLLPDEGACR